MKRYNINVIEHELDNVQNTSRTASELYDMCRENSIRYTTDFCRRFGTYDTFDEATAVFQRLEPKTLIYDGRGANVILLVTGYELEEAECDDEDGEQYDWNFLDLKFKEIIKDED